MNTAPIRALTLDLDDTLWPIWPAIQRAEAALHAWLAIHAPATAARFDCAGLRALRDRVTLERPEWAHDLSALRRESVRMALAEARDDVDLADAAFDVFFAERQRVEFYPDVLDALQRLAKAYPLLALSNGNADLSAVGLATWFRGGLSAREFGVGKPDSRIFAEACRRLGFAAGEVLHVGDDLELDVRGAHGAGLQAVWLCRGDGSAGAGIEGIATVCDLLALADRLGC
ncbi:MAG TPA: HAD-IA family hydrolase [Albitalea sp.]|nr:HAD-IA family hydrolase [Albitalea sp.]